MRWILKHKGIFIFLAIWQAYLLIGGMTGSYIKSQTKCVQSYQIDRLICDRRVTVDAFFGSIFWPVYWPIHIGANIL